jgi:hypothetical protein
LIMKSMPYDNCKPRSLALWLMNYRSALALAITKQYGFEVPVDYIMPEYIELPATTGFVENAPLRTITWYTVNSARCNKRGMIQGNCHV